jgi:DNA topoisomerase-1
MTRLRRSDLRGPGVHRVRRGKGFAFVDESGRPVDAATRERAVALVIPPAWRDVWVAPHANGHVQATGIDEAGRRQYLYHPAWRAQKDRLKFDRMLELAAVLPAARRAVTLDLRRDDVSRERVLAAAFRMLDTGMLRVGSRFPPRAASRGSRRSRMPTSPRSSAC